MFKHVTIIGLGLIGGSIGLAIQKHMPVTTVTGWDFDKRHRTTAKQKHLVTNVVNTFEEAEDGAELIIFAVPETALTKLANKVSNKSAIIIDTCSTKRGIFDTIANVCLSNPIIPTHPIAGTEYSGPEAAVFDLFDDKIWIITPPEGYDTLVMEKIQSLIISLNAIPLLMDSNKHDDILGLTSHLPHVIAYTLANTIANTVTGYESCSSGGLKGMLRIANSDPYLWSDIIMKNRDYILPHLQSFIDQLEQMKRDIKVENGRAIQRSLLNGRDIASKFK